MRSGRAPTLRIRRPHWRDPRLGIGVVLVALAVALGAWTFAQADRTEPVYEARETITAGESLDEETLVLTRVRLAGLEERYLTPDALEPGSIATRTIGAGELVPVGAVGRAEHVRVRPMTITTTAATPVEAGMRVDLWVAARDPQTRDLGEPELIAPAVTVRSVTEDSSMFAAGGARAVELLVPEELVPAVLAAINGESAISLVPLIGSADG